MEKLTKTAAELQKSVARTQELAQQFRTQAREARDALAAMEVRAGRIEECAVSARKEADALLAEAHEASKKVGGLRLTKGE